MGLRIDKICKIPLNSSYIFSIGYKSVMFTCYLLHVLYREILPGWRRPILLFFPQLYANSKWNLNNLPALPNSVLSHVSGNISGMKVGIKTPIEFVVILNCLKLCEMTLSRFSEVFIFVIIIHLTVVCFPHFAFLSWMCSAWPFCISEEPQICSHAWVEIFEKKIKHSFTSCI